MTALETEVNRNLLRYAVGRALYCRCGDVLDARSAIMTAGPSGSAVECARCYARAPFCARVPVMGGSDFYVVLDGRALWPWTPAVPRRRRTRRTAR